MRGSSTCCEGDIRVAVDMKSNGTGNVIYWDWECNNLRSLLIGDIRN